MKHRYGTLSREVAAEAAVELGFQGLTLTAVAERLGVTAAALYYHVADRNDLFRAAIDRVAASDLEPIGPIDDVAVFVRAEATRLFELFAKYPGLTAALRSLDLPPESFGMRVAEAHRALTDHGMAPERAFLTLAVMYSHALETATWLTSPDMVSLAQASGGLVADRREDGFVRLMATFAASPPEDTFQQMLDILIHGVDSG
ncbi:MAG: helix-turn-helix domain-containing protein [Actinomycetota bacterium]